MPSHPSNELTRILLVEDSDRDAQLVRTVLGKSPVVVERVESLGAALVALRSSTFDLILTDLGLPDSEGTGTVETLLDEAGVTPVVVITGHGDDATLHEAVEAGAHDYLVKGGPHVARQLLRVVQYALERAKERHDDDRDEILSANAKFRTLIDCSEVTVVLDVDRHCTYVSPSITQLLGYEPAELVGRPAQSFLCAMRVDGTTPGTTGGRLRHKDGRTIDVDITVTPLLREKRALVGTVVTFHDLVSQRALEQNVEQTLRLAMLGRASASAIHELNTLMAVVAQHTELLLKRIGEDAQLANPITLIRDAIRRGRRVSDQILRFTRAPEPTFESIDVSAWLERTANDARALIDGRTLLVELPRSLHIRADADQLSQVIFNMVTNARDATPANGVVTIGAARADSIRFVREHVDDASHFTAIFVCDTGSGISEQARERLFEPLFTTKPDGTGFGLATSFRIVARHGGRILVDSEPGAGSTFYILLPKQLATSDRSGR